MSNLETNRGQAALEFALLFPVFIAIAAMMMFVTYVCWQGIKAQQAANYAARVIGQERVAGGQSPSQIDQKNGFQQGASWGSTPPQPIGGSMSVYARYKTSVEHFFGQLDPQELMCFPPITRLNSDEVNIKRHIKFPAISFLDQQTIDLNARAYGGEDSYMFGLPRFGSDTADGPYWRSLLKKVPKNGTSYD